MVSILILVMIMSARFGVYFHRLMGSETITTMFDVESIGHAISDGNSQNTDTQSEAFSYYYWLSTLGNSKICIVLFGWFQRFAPTPVYPSAVLAEFIYVLAVVSLCKW